MKLDIEIFNVNTSSSGELKVSENTTDTMLPISSAGGIEADNLKVKSCDASAFSGGEVSIHVTESLDVDAGSGGRVSYEGSPKKLKKNTSSGGSINED